MTSLEILVERIDNLIKQSDKQHADNAKRLDRIDEHQQKTSDRMSAAEKAIGIHWWALICIGAILTLVLAAILAKVL